MRRLAILVPLAVAVALLTPAATAAPRTYTQIGSTGGFLGPGETDTLTVSCDEGDTLDSRGGSISVVGNVRVPSQSQVIRPTGSYTIAVTNESTETQMYEATVRITCKDAKPYRV